MSAVRISSRYEWDPFFGPPVLLGEGVESSRPWRGSDPTAARSAEERRLLDGFQDLERGQRDEHDAITTHRLETNEMRVARGQLQPQRQQPLAGTGGAVRTLPAAPVVASPPPPGASSRSSRPDDDVELLIVPSLIAAREQQAASQVRVPAATNSDDDLLGDDPRVVPLHKLTPLVGDGATQSAADFL